VATISISPASPASARRDYTGPAFLSGGFRPFFLLGATWAVLAVPLWLAAYLRGYGVPGALPAMLWHAHEMIFGYGLAVVTGFLLTAIPNWTGRLPITGVPLAALAVLWIAGRVAMFTSPVAAAAIDLAYTVVLAAVVAREVVAAQRFHNLPVVATLVLLLAGNALVHLQALDLAYTAPLGNRIGIATLIALISLIGGRIVPSFTRNWLARLRPEVPEPATHDRIDTLCLVAVVAALIAWVAVPDTALSGALAIAGGIAVTVRLARWRGLATWREPLLFVLHVGYAWVAIGLLLLGVNELSPFAPPGAPVHALTVGAIGTMTLAVMTRASLGHTGGALVAGKGTLAIYLLVTIAALLRIAAPLTASPVILTSLAGFAWTGAFGLFALLYGPSLIRKKQ
jgi:uncharacterized protein involved in response to NO